MRQRQYHFPCPKCETLPGVTCTAEACSVAGPGAEPGQCRACYLAHGGDPSVRADGRPARSRAVTAVPLVECPSCGTGVKFKTHAGMRPQDLAKLLAQGTPAGMPAGWETWPVTRHARHLAGHFKGDTWPRHLDEHNLCVGAPGLRFNPSLIPWGEGYLFAWRSGWEGSEIYLVRMDRQFQPAGEAVRLTLFHPQRANYGREDPRLFTFRGRLHVSYSGVAGHWGPTNLMYARLSDSLQVEEVFYPHYIHRNDWEKNWAFFEFERELYAVYTIAPHRVLWIDGGRAVLAYDSPTSLRWPGGEMRGGAAPVRVDAEFWHFFHDRIPGPGGPDGPIYRMGLVTFEARPPFRITRHIPGPILAARWSEKPSDQYAAVVFPGGAVRDGDSWVIACGMHDRWSTLHRFDHAELESQLRPTGGSRI